MIPYQPQLYSLFTLPLKYDPKRIFFLTLTLYLTKLIPLGKQQYNKYIAKAIMGNVKEYNYGTISNSGELPFSSQY